MAQAAPMPMCPMAETCKGMMGKPLPGLAVVRWNLTCNARQRTY